MSAPVVSLSGVRKAYGSTRTLYRVDLELRRRIVGLLGPNGAGKSTLLRLIATAMATGAFFALVPPLKERPAFPHLQTGPWSASRLGWGWRPPSPPAYCSAA